MQCKAIQIQLSVGASLTSSEVQHVEACHECQAHRRFLSNILGDAAHIRDEEPNAILESRIRLAVRKPASRYSSQPTWVRRLQIVGVAAVALGGVIALKVPNHRGAVAPGEKPLGFASVMLAFTGGDVAEASFHRLDRSISDAQTVHIEEWGTYDETGKPVDAMRKLGDIWWKPGSLRRTEGASFGGDRLFTTENGQVRYHRFDSAQGRIIDMDEGSKQLAGVSVEELVNGFNADVHDLKIDAPVTDATKETIVAHSDGDYHQFVFVGDSKTHRLQNVEMQHLVDGKYVSYYQLKVHIDETVPAAKFDPSDLARKP